MPRKKKAEVQEPQQVSDVTLEVLIEASAHLGHRRTRWNPKISQYVYGVQDGVHIFDLEKTRVKLLEAMEELKTRAAKGEIIVLVGTKNQAKDIVRQTGQKLGIPYIADRWIGGLLTNFPQLKHRIDKLGKMKQEREAGEYKKFTKKEQLLLDREIAHLEKLFGGVAQLNRIPDILIIIDTKKERTAVAEARKTGVATAAIVDTNSDPSLIDFPIPANDDAIKSIEYIIGKLGEAIEEGLALRAKSKEQEGIPIAAAA